MKQKEYIERLVSLIINRVKYHAPRIQNQDIDYGLLRALNINEKYPIFIFNKPLTKVFYKAFLMVKRNYKFNLILLKEPLIVHQKIRALNDTFIFAENVGENFLQMINELNINYPSVTTFDCSRNKEYLKLDNKVIKLDFVPFYKHYKQMHGGTIVDVKQFLLNGKNYMLELTNTRDHVNTIDFEMNLPLPRGYYFFKKTFNFIKIFNLTTQETAYFNYFLKNLQVNYSCVDGLENSSYPCINLKAQITLKPKQKKCLFFNLGLEKFNLISTNEIHLFFTKSQQEMFKIFNTKITSKNIKFDQEFNQELPMQIWDAWNNFSYNQYAEDRWLSMKSSVIQDCEMGIQICEKTLPLKEVQIYQNNVWKRVFIMYGDSQYLFAGRIKYFNFTILTKEIFDKNNEIYLSFAS